MALSNVSTGDKITARWANSLINEVNKLQPLEIKNTRMDYTGVDFTCMADYSEAFHMEWSNGNITLNAGQIYLNGQLIRPDKANNSYNQFSSVENYSEYEVIDIQDTIPELAIEIKIPKNYSDEKIKEVKAHIVEIKKDNSTGEQKPEEPSEEEAKFDKITIQINELTADKKDFVQLVSGSIYLYTNANLPKDKEGIIICDEENEVENKETGEKTKVTTKVIKLNVSIIGEDGIEVLDSLYNSSYTKPEEENPDGEEEEEKEEENPVRKFFIRGKRISFVGEDGITIEETKEMISQDEGGTLETPKEQTIYTIRGKGLSIIAGDGISIIHTDDLENVDCYEIVATGANNISFVGLDKIKITEREGVGDNSETRKEIYVLNDHFSLIPTDNLRIEKEDGECDFTDGSFSFKRNWETNKLKSKFISLKEGNNVKLVKNEVDTPEKWEDEYTINAKIISVVAGDNIRVDVNEDEFGKSYTVHADITSLIEFDPIYFVVEDGTVSLKEEVLNEIVEEAINEIGVEVVGEGLIESTFMGDLKANTAGTLTLNTSVSY